MNNPDFGTINLDPRKSKSLSLYGLSEVHNDCHLVDIGESFFYPIAFKGEINFPIYKFIKPDYADSFYNHGTIRLGTFWDFAREDLHGSVVGDINEGTIFHTWNFDKIPNKKYVYCALAVNSFTFCASKSYKEILRSDFGKSVIEILDMGFFAEITKKIIRNIGPCVIGS